MSYTRLLVMQKNPNLLRDNCCINLKKISGENSTDVRVLVNFLCCLCSCLLTFQELSSHLWCVWISPTRFLGIQKKRPSMKRVKSGV